MLMSRGEEEDIKSLETNFILDCMHNLNKFALGFEMLVPSF